MASKKLKAKHFDLNRKLFIRTVKTILFILFIIMTATVIWQSRDRWQFIGVVGIAAVAVYALNFFYVKNSKVSLALYIVLFFLFLVMAFVIKDTFVSTLYIIVLSDFYLSYSFKSSAYMGIFTFIAYILAVTFSKVKVIEDLPSLYARLIQDFIVFLLDFVIITLSVTVLRRNIEIERNLEIVHKREQKLKEAYNRLEEVTILEERNRIAKEIHDTTGHSITTIIMQTEAAKLIIDKDAKEAKTKIISANLQAVNALEELRQSVKLLSGGETAFNLSSSIIKTLEETMSGTDIVIRNKVDEVQCPEDIARFIYSTLKEGLNNGIRHGKSTAFYVELKNTPSGFTFMISDNGKGVNLKKLELGYGLKSMRDKAKQLGGNIYFVSEEGEGFEIHITFNYKDKAD